jgi:hypothetical protein
MSNSGFEFAFSNGFGEVRFTSPEMLAEYLDKHIAFYSKFDPETFQQGKQPTAHARSSLERALRAKSVVDQFKSGGATAEQLAAIGTASFNRVPPYDSKTAALLYDLYDRLGPDAASGLLAVYSSSGYPLTTGEPLALEGAISLILLKNHIGADTSKMVTSELTALRSAYQDHLNADELRSQKVFDRLNLEREQSETARENSVAWWMAKADELQKLVSSKIDEKIKDFENTQRAYEESMRLLRPRAYWTKKSKGHEVRALWLGIAALGWILLAGAATGYGIWQLFLLAVHYSLNLEEGKTLPATVLASLGAIGVAGTTSVFWIGRLAVRLWLSELHLGMDGRERVTMIESYLALSKTGTVEDKRRELVLAAIFRPTQDGIVKDDAASDPTLVGLLTKQRV